MESERESGKERFEVCFYLIRSWLVRSSNGLGKRLAHIKHELVSVFYPDHALLII